ncbi:histidine kinase [Vibrio cholerae]|nr:histidine kinase [Vibrio cholerae]
MRQLFATGAQNTTSKSMAKKSRLGESAYCFLSQDHALNG